MTSPKDGAHWGLQEPSKEESWGGKGQKGEMPWGLGPTFT